MRKTLPAHILLLLLPFCAAAQKATFEFFTTADGLAGNNTTSVTQDDRGFIWLVNDGKLHRYDGRNFVVCPVPDELSAGEEHLAGLVIWQDSLLFVWSEHFPFLFNPKTGVWQPIQLKKQDTKNDGSRYWTWLGQGNIVMTRVKKGSGPAYAWHAQDGPHESGFPAQYPLLLDAYYWRSLNAFDYTLRYQDTVYQLDRSGRTVTTTLLDNICTDCANLWFQSGPDGTLVLLENRRFFILDKQKNRFVPHPANRFLKDGHNFLLRFNLEKNGSIWACGYDRSLVYYDAPADTLYNFSDELKQLLPNRNDFMGVFQDRAGVVWIDTRLGLLKVRPQSSPFDTYFSGLNPSNLYSSFRGFTEDTQGMMYGVYYDGIARFDPAKKQPPRNYTFQSILNLFDLSTEGDMIWINGGQLLDPKSGRLKNLPSPLYENPVSDNGFFAKDKHGTLWWASHYFLYRLDKSGNRFQWIKELELPEKIFNKTDALHSGIQSDKLWLSFNGKLLQYAPETKTQQWFDLKSWGLSVSRITVIEEDRDGKLWLGSDAGLVQVDPALAMASADKPANGAHRQYTVNDGLPNNFICGLLTEGDSCLWLSTNHGLSRFHIQSGAFVNFFEEDGLTYNEFNRKSYFKASNGRMFFGGMRGVNAFFPEAVMRAYQNRDQSVRMVLSAVEYTDERRDTIVRETQFASPPEIHLHYWDWSYTFEYALTDYDNPKETFYSYKMEGYKDGWSAPSKFNFARFNSLPAGEYVFRVKARDSRGRWHPHELAVKVIVHPPWWATWWAYLAYFLLLSGLAYTIYCFLKKRLLLQNQLKLEQAEAYRLKELDHFKSRLYTNLTHEFRTPLTVILGMANQLAVGGWQSAVNTAEKQNISGGLTLIKNNGQSLLRLINQLLDLSKLENKSFQLHLQQADIVPYLRYVTESFQTYANSRNLSLRFFSTQESLVMDYDPEQIKQVLTNLISNALKFTPSGGEVAVRVRAVNLPGLQDLESLELAVTDTGIGIAEKDLPHVFDRFYQVDGSHTRKGEKTDIGLAHTQELMKIMGGEISVESEVGKGATFLVRLPIAKNPPISVPASNRVTSSHPVTTPSEGLLNFQSLVNLPESHPLTSPDNLSLITHNSALPQLLIIEDNPDVVVYLKSCLDGLYQLDVAYNGKIGIEKALENIPDLVISDVMMPEKDGYQVCDTLKNDERSSHIPIILLTAKADAASKMAGLRRGADAYLTKPFDKEELLLQLEVLAEKQKRLLAHFSRVNPAAAIAPNPEDAFELEDAFVQKVTQIVAEHFADEDFGLPQLCQKTGLSRSQLFRKMKALMDTSPSDFIRSYRLNKAKILLETTRLNVSEVAWQTGYKNRGHFSTAFQEEFGFPPSATSK